MIYTNTDQYGDKLLHQLDEAFSNSNGVSVASGYTSLDILNRYRDGFVRIAQNGGQSRLLVGMAFYEGLSQSKLDMLNALSNELQLLGEGNGVFVCYVRKFHGKIYKFDNSSKSKIFIGSSNFSRSGLSENIEATIPVVDEASRNSISSFMDYMFNPDMSVVIEKADIIVPGSAKFKQRVSLSTLSDLQRYDPESINLTGLRYFDYSLARVASSEKSSLNVYFGKGRWSRSTGKVKPRDWYEVELIAKNELSRLDIYPKGNFTAYTNDGYVMPMRTSGDYYKNIRSQGNLRLLGMWIKKKLQDSEALIPLTPVTQDTLDQYGRDSIRFYKLSDTKYYIDF
jgi:hypothetical protein